MTHLTIDTEINDLRFWAECYSAPIVLNLSSRAVEAVKNSYKAVQTILAAGDAVYGINTGFGSLSNKIISAEDLGRLQENLVLSHTVGGGAPLSIRVVRLTIALKIASFAKGFSGVRLEVVERLQLFLEHQVYPIIPDQGSVGASGDLAPLAHLAAAIIGYGDVHFGGQIVSAESAHNSLGILPLKFEAKEGLALLNGTQISTALGLAGLFEADRAFETAVVVGAITTEAVLGLEEAFDERIHALRRQKGQIEVAAKLRALISGSGFRGPSTMTGRRQDPYSIRCQPQILGPCQDILLQVGDILNREADAVTDNPLVFADDLKVMSGGNFHAQPVAFAADMVAIAICEIGTLSERRLALMTDSSMSGLPPFLTSEPGLNCGFMSAQIAAAAMVAENRQCAHPASVDNVPTVANMEDVVSMATHGAKRLLKMVDVLDNILAFELLAAVEGCDHRGLRLSPALDSVRSVVRETVPRMNFDRFFAPAQSEARRLVRQGTIPQRAGINTLLLVE